MGFPWQICFLPSSVNTGLTFAGFNGFSWGLVKKRDVWFTSVCISTQPCPPCWQWAQPRCQPGIQRDSASQILTRAAREELRKFLGKQRSLGVNFSSKKPQRLLDVGALWVTSSAGSGSILGWCSGHSRTSQHSSVPLVLSRVTNPSIFPPTSKTKMPNSPSDGHREQLPPAEVWDQPWNIIP